MTNAGTSREPPLRADDDAGVFDKCLLRDAAGIRAQLQQLIDKRCMLTASTDAGASSVLTAALAIDDTTLWIDIPASAAVLEHLLGDARLLFEGAIDKVTLRFSSGPATLGIHDGRTALCVPVPRRLLHLQRRELMRREPPPGALHCLVPAGDTASGSPPTVATIRDIGGGGLAVLVTDVALVLAAGDHLHGCQIELPGLGTVEVTLHVRHVRELRQHHRNFLHAGCEFVDLPAATQAKLFRYLMQLDREQLARRRELDTG